MKNILFFIILIYAITSFAGCDVSETNVIKDNVVEDMSVPHPLPNTTDIEEFPPRAPLI